MPTPDRDPACATGPGRFNAHTARSAIGAPLAHLTVLATAGLLAACTSPGGLSTGPAGAAATAQLSPATGAALRGCEALASQFSFADTRIDSAAPLAAGPIAPSNHRVDAHCLVKGQMKPRKGVDGQDYAIGFEMRLPQAWNGRFYYQANGGIDGTVQPAHGALGGGPLTGALAQGFAVISSDAGHTSRQNPRFGADPQARADYGHQAVGTLTPMAKALIASAYGKGPERSYIGGCSNGGRHALVAAARHNAHYDGYLVGAPGYRLPNAALAQLWGAAQWAPLATPGATMAHPFAPNVQIRDLGTALTAAERATVARAIAQRCDALDGARDGIVAHPAACQTQFDLARDVPSCSGARDGQCLTAEQKRVLGQAHAGARTPGGQLLYTGFPWDTGIAGTDWARWKFVNSQVLDPAAGYIFMSPPRSVDPFKLDLDAAYQAVYAVDPAFGASADATISMPGQANPVNLAGLRARGGKVLVYHGVSDAVFSHLDTVALMQRIDQAQGGRGADFARYFPVPGMAHCSGGPATDQFDALTPLVRWVEQGVAPTGIPATARGAGNAAAVNPELPADWAPNRSRTLCPWPSVSTYNGSGALDAASSFSCKAP